MSINWDDPTARFHLIERVGPDEYERLQAEHQKKSIVAVVNGHAIRPVDSRFGQLFNVGRTGTAFSTLGEAETFAKDQPPGPDDPLGHDQPAPKSAPRG